MMEITESLSLVAKKMMHDPIFCPIRKIWVASLPEEKIRQALIKKMVSELGFPINSIALEKNFNQIPHLVHKGPFPKRRIDLLVFSQNIHNDFDFYPLLMIEFKAIPLNKKVLRQVIGYNQFVNACFIAAANDSTISFGWFDPSQKNYVFQENLPEYHFLLEKARLRK